jgi:translocation and assembly module TamB
VKAASRKAFLVLLFLILASAGVIAFLRSRFAWDQACAILERQLPSVLGMKVGIGRCEIDPLRQTLKVFELTASDSRGVRILAADSIEVRLGSLRPLFGQAQVDLVRVSRPLIDLALDAEPPAAQSTKPAACPLDILRKVRISQLEADGASIRVRLPDGRAAAIDDLTVRWEQRRSSAQFQLTATQGAWREGRSELELSKLWLTGIYDISAEQLQVTQADIELGESSFAVSGTIEHPCHPVLSLDGQALIPAVTLKRAGLLTGEVGGNFRLRAQARGPLEHPTVNARISGKEIAIEDFRPGDFEARLSSAPGEVKLEELSLSTGPGKLKVSGTLKLLKNLPLRLRADLEGVSFARVLEKAGLPGAWMDFPATGRVTVAGHLLPFQLSGDADLKAGKFILATRPFNAPAHRGMTVLNIEQSRINLGVRFLRDRVEMNHFRIDTGKSQVTGDVTLFFDSSKGVQINAVADPLNLSDYKEVAGFQSSGTGAVQVQIAGPYGEVGLEANANFRDLDFWYFSLGALQGKVRYRNKTLAFDSLTGHKGETRYSAAGQIRFGSELYTSWDVRVPHGRTADLLDAIAGLNPMFELFQGPSGGEASGSVHIDGPVRRLTGAVQFDLQNTTYYGRRLGDGGVALRFLNGESLVVDRAALTGPMGRLSGKGSYAFDGPLNFRFRADELSLAELVGADRGQAMGIGGSGTVVGKVVGVSTTPEVSAYWTCPQVKYAEKGIGEGHLEMRVLGRDLEVWGRPFADARGSARLKLREPYPYSADISIALPEIRPLLPASAASQGLSGSLQGTLNAQGEISKAGSLSLSANIEKLSLARGDFSGQNDGPVAVTYRDRRLEIDQLRFRGANTELTLTGSASPQLVDLKMNGNVDFRLLESFTPALERSAGRLDLSAAVGGTLKDPSILGSAEFREVRLALRNQPLSARNLSGRIEFSEARVLIQDVHGILNEGRVSFRGNINLKRFALTSVDLGLQLDEVSFRPKEDLPMALTGELNLSGKPNGMVLAGDLDIVRLRYDRPLVVQSLFAQIQSAQSSYFPEAAAEWLSFDVGLHARGDVRVDNNVARAKLVGDLRLTGTNTHPGLLGVLQAADGSQAYYRGNQFAVTQGMIEFKERRSIEAVFDLHAETQVREYLVRLHAFGRLADPKVILNAEPELPEGDILSLLTLGVTSRDRTNTAGTSAGLAAEALFTTTGLDRQVQRFLPKNPVLRDFSFHISSSYNDYKSVVEPTWQFESKFLTEQLKLRFTEPFSGIGRKAQAEYRFDNRLSAQAQWDNEDTKTSYGNLGLNLKLHWEVD